MIPSNNKIVVSVDTHQKDKATIAGKEIFLAKNFSTNRRESNPVICTAETSGQGIKKGDVLLVHHNRFVENGPNQIDDNRFVIPCNENIYIRIGKLGELEPLFGNLIVERIYKESSPVIPEHLWKVDKHKFKVLDGGIYFKGSDFVFTFVHSDYEIVYVWDNQEKRTVIVQNNDVVGFI